VADSRDGTATSPKPRVRVGKLDTTVRCRRELRKLYAEARSGELATQDATRLCFLVATIAKMLEVDDLARLEARIIALERLKR